MEVNKLQKDLKYLYKGIETKALSFSFEESNETIRYITMFKKGYWSVMPFGFSSDSIIGVSLSPNFSSDNMPLVQFDDIVNVCTTFAPSLKSLFSMVRLKYTRTERLIELLKRDVNETLKQAIPFQKYVEGENELNFYIDYLLNEENQIAFKNDSDIKSKFYVDFWNHYNGSPEQDKTIALLNELLDKSNYLPDFEEIDYGIWSAYIYNVLAGRAYSKGKLTTKDKWRFYWKSVQQPHGFDAMGGVLSGLEPSLKSSNSTLFGIVDSFNSSWKQEYESFPEEVREHPIFHATESIRIKGGAYIGEEHLLAAAVLDEKYNDSIGAWNALITAGYWAGLNQSPAVEIVWEAGIHLAEKHNWTEIHEVLVQQYEYYNHYKDKV